MKKKSVLNVLTLIVGVMLVFGFTGCDDLLNQITGGNTDTNLSGSISISPSGTVAVGTQLTANYTGNEYVSYQ